MHKTFGQIAEHFEYYSPTYIYIYIYIDMYIGPCFNFIQKTPFTELTQVTNGDRIHAVGKYEILDILYKIIYIYLSE